MGYLEWYVRDLAIGWHRLMMDSQIGTALILILQRVNKARVSSAHDARQDEEEEVLAVLHQASHRLAVYGHRIPPPASAPSSSAYRLARTR